MMSAEGRRELTTTLKAIGVVGARADGWRKLTFALDQAGHDHDAPVSFERILNATSLGFALWCARSAPQHNEHWRGYSRWLARRAVHLWPAPAVVRNYLEHGDETLRFEALIATRDYIWGIERQDDPEYNWAATMMAWAAAQDPQWAASDGPWTMLTVLSVPAFGLKAATERLEQETAFLQMVRTGELP